MALDFPSPATTNQIWNGWLFDGQKWVQATGSQPYDLTPALNDTGRNFIHNPRFDIAQRGQGPFTASGYTLDRWWAGASGTGSAISVQQPALSDAQRAAIGDEAATWCFYNTFTGTAGAADWVLASQYIEGVRRLSGKMVTVSFWAQAAAGTPRLGVSLDQSFGSGGSPSANVSGSGQSVQISTAFARYALTFTLPSAAGATLGTNHNDCTGLNFWFSSGATNATRSGNVGVQSGTFILWGIQLEVGSGAGYPTPLARRDPQQELALCQRFYQVHPGVGCQTYGAAGQAVGFEFSLPVTMRVPQTVTFANQAYSNASAFAGINYQPTHLRLGFTVTSAAPSAASADVTISADL